MKIDLSDEELARVIELLELADHSELSTEIDDELYPKLIDCWEKYMGVEWISPNSPISDFKVSPAKLWDED